ncbi:putative tail component protein [Rhizobium phage RHph_X2_26]|nr:putative tail component protein [Rhizobium phage RHph_X2_26]
MALRVIGLARLKKKFDRLPGEVRAEVRRAMEVVAQEIVDMAKSLVPVGDYAGGGALRESINWTWGKAPKGAMTLASVQGKETAGDLTITVYAGDSEAFYARWVEFGTSAHSTAPGALLKSNKRQGGDRQHPGADARPFFFVSYRAKRRSAKARVSRAVTKAARKVAASA